MGIHYNRIVYSRIAYNSLELRTKIPDYDLGARFGLFSGFDHVQRSLLFLRCMNSIFPYKALRRSLSMRAVITCHGPVITVTDDDTVCRDAPR